MSEIITASPLSASLCQWLAARQYDGRQVLLVCDDNTYQAAAKTILEHLPEIDLLNFGRRVKADTKTAERIIAQAEKKNLIIAVGSGTINDICKYAAHERQIPYLCVATAPSMNGYLSPTASLADGRKKQSFAATAPLALWIDNAILQHAPVRLIRAGLADALARPSVEVDMLLAHYLFDAPYPAALFNKMRALEAPMLTQPAAVVERQPQAVNQLMQALLYGGQAMGEFGSSAVASQSEHMIAHCYEMLYDDANSVLHGEAIAVTTLTSLRLQEKRLQKRPNLISNQVAESRFERIFGQKRVSLLYPLYQQKTFDSAAASLLNERLAHHWEDLRRAIEAVQIKAITLETAYRHCAIPYDYSQLGWLKDRYEHAVSVAYLTRERFTFLDIVGMDVSLRAQI